MLPGFNFLIGTEAEPQLIINALHAVTDVKILSNPSLVVVDNQFATLQVGDQIPVTTQSAQSVIAPGAPVVNNIDYRNTGIILRVAPRINANGNVLLNIEQEISAVADNGNANYADPDCIAAQGGKLDCGRQRTDRTAGGIGQRNAKPQPQRHSGPRSNPRRRRAVFAEQRNGSAHRADHLHPTADYPKWG